MRGLGPGVPQDPVVGGGGHWEGGGGEAALQASLAPLAGQAGQRHPLTAPLRSGAPSQAPTQGGAAGAEECWTCGQLGGPHLLLLCCWWRILWSGLGKLVFNKVELGSLFVDWLFVERLLVKRLFAGKLLV